jgi:hypothetical protein
MVYIPDLVLYKKHTGRRDDAFTAGGEPRPATRLT